MVIYAASTDDELRDRLNLLEIPIDEIRNNRGATLFHKAAEKRKLSKLLVLIDYIKNTKKLSGKEYDKCINAKTLDPI